MIEDSDLLRLVEGECSPEEAAAIQAWVAADPARGELLDQVRALWRLTGDPSRPWDLAGARDRLLRVRGRHAAQRSGGLPARSRATGFLRMARAGPLPVWRRVWVASPWVLRIAVALGTEPDRRQRARKEILERSAALFEDKRAVHEFERFLREALSLRR